MAEELISVILPVYNIEKYLEKWHVIAVLSDLFQSGVCDCG